MKEIKLTKEQFKLFNQYDQFAIFDEEGFGDFNDFDEEVDKLFSEYDFVIVTENDYIYGAKGHQRVVLSDQATEGYDIAEECLE